MSPEIKAIIIIAIGLIIMLGLAFTNAYAFFIGQIVVQIAMLIGAVAVTLGLTESRKRSSSGGES